MARRRSRNMANAPSETGSIPPNLHEGSRSEYLAQYIFSSFGTSIPVPHQEDSGLDLYCTLVEQVGRRSWPRRYYAVQVKSSDDPWQFNSPESVRWFLEFPQPLLFCIVTKKEARLQVYHTFPRFFIWAHPPLPLGFTVVPGTGRQGQSTDHARAGSFSLTAPILDFTITQVLDDAFHELVFQILDYWVQVDLANLHRLRTGIHQFAMPAAYTTNQIPGEAGINIREGGVQPSDVNNAIQIMAGQLEWVTRQLSLTGDYAGAVRGAILLRHLFPHATPIALANLFMQINQSMGRTPPAYLCDGLDELNRQLTDRIPPPSHVPLPAEFATRLHPPES